MLLQQFKYYITRAYLCASCTQFITERDRKLKYTSLNRWIYILSYLIYDIMGVDVSLTCIPMIRIYKQNAKLITRMAGRKLNATLIRYQYCMLLFRLRHLFDKNNHRIEL